MGFVVKRLVSFIKSDPRCQELVKECIDEGMTDKDKMAHILQAFQEKMAETEDPRDALTDEEAFQDYNNYRMSRKDLIPQVKLEEMIDGRWQYLYRKRNFKNLRSRKSLEYLKNWVYFKVKNCYVIAYGCDVDSFGMVETSFLALEEIPTKLGSLYVMRDTYIEDLVVLFTGHFFDRYVERNELRLDRQGAIETFLRSEFDTTLNGLQIAVNPENSHCSITVNNGMCLGHSIKDIRIFKTFVNGDLLSNNQINEALESMIIRAHSEE